MENDRHAIVDLFIPRKCSFSNKLITPKDHSSVQINVAHVGPEGQAIQGQASTFTLCGDIRTQGRGDEALNSLCTEAGFLKETYRF